MVSGSDGPTALNDAGRAGLEQGGRERPEVARVDELDGLVRLGREHLAAAGHAPRPVDEPLGGIARADDQAAAQDHRGAREALRGDPLAEHLQPP